MKVRGMVCIVDCAVRARDVSTTHRSHVSGKAVPKYAARLTLACSTLQSEGRKVLYGSAGQAEPLERWLQDGVVLQPSRAFFTKSNNGLRGRKLLFHTRREFSQNELPKLVQ